MATTNTNARRYQHQYHRRRVMTMPPSGAAYEDVDIFHNDSVEPCSVGPRLSRSEMDSLLPLRDDDCVGRNKYRKRSGVNAALNALLASLDMSLIKEYASRVLWLPSSGTSSVGMGRQHRDLESDDDANTALLEKMKGSARSTERTALHKVTTLRAQVNARRKTETMEDMHEKALLQLAAITVGAAILLIIALCRQASSSQ
ncbi:hypothetical protein PINS_up006340 [Pythium insidiosum]|nr:hypothetical protein PINS_up006340 [Pythium insidiosum]